MTTDERLAELRAMLARPFLVEYCYPTSTHAARLHMSRTGAYYVSAFDATSCLRPCVSCGYLTRAEADRECARLTAEVAP